MENKVKIIQKAVHTNGYIQTYRYTQANTYTRQNTYSRSYSNGGYSWHANSGCNTWRDGSWNDGWCENNSIYERSNWSQDSYSQRNDYANTNYTQATSTRTDFNTVNKSPTVAWGSATPNGGTVGTNSITINLTNMTYSDNESNAVSQYKIYYTYSSNNSTYGVYTELATLTNGTKTYTWNITNCSTGYYKIAVIAFDGNSWSAVLNTDKKTWKSDYKLGTAPTAGANQQVVLTENTDYETITYALSPAIHIVKYTPPTWIQNPFTKETHDQLMTEINKARTGVGLAAYTFTNASIVEDFTIITENDIQELRTSANAAYKEVTGNDYVFTNSLSDSDINKTIRRGQDVLDIQTLLTNLSK